MSDDFGKDLMDRSGEDSDFAASSPHEKSKKANEAQLSGTILDGRGNRPDTKPDSTNDKSDYKERFSVLPSTTNYTRIEPHFGHPANRARANTAGGTRSDTPSMRSNASTGALHMQTKGESQTKERVTSENYTRIYLQKKRESEDLARQLKAGGSATPAADNRKQREQETMNRNHARELITQIQWWQGQYGQPDRDDQYVSGMIALLQSQLNAIDPQYWP